MPGEFRMESKRPIIGFIGLGAMGGEMARNLINTGYPLIGFDINSERLAACVSVGATAGTDIDDVIQRGEIVLTSLRSSKIFVEVAENHFLPHARSGQTFIDLGTTTAPETRHLANALATKGAMLVDAPVSGGPQGAKQGMLYICRCPVPSNTGNSGQSRASCTLWSKRRGASGQGCQSTCYGIGDCCLFRGDGFWRSIRSVS